ncbi:hypothetical protein Tsubulata_012617 [Turnera subulata]|uniref:Uncharacterized protein n=1 Tax=Turnera subulata TaxID=218843 RepID=A0A9Q0FMJ7_9ROSI|nr:hypothetical protein Tsubulata_012617 [Turnera subulata]
MDKRRGVRKLELKEVSGYGWHGKKMKVGNLNLNLREGAPGNDRLQLGFMIDLHCYPFTTTTARAYLGILDGDDSFLSYSYHQSFR